jgi:predicted nucleic acid-binding protein
VAHVAVLDANVLIPMPLCDTLLRLAQKDVFKPRWSAETLEEVRRHPLGEAAADPDKLARRIAAMTNAFPGAEVTGYQDLTNEMTNDPKDRHVLAAAVHSGASQIVTANLSDFPPAACDPYDIRVVHPDDFLLTVWRDEPDLMIEVIKEQAAGTRKPPLTSDQVLDSLARTGAPRFASAIRGGLSGDRPRTEHVPASGLGAANAAQAFPRTTRQTLTNPTARTDSPKGTAGPVTRPARDPDEQQR